MARCTWRCSALKQQGAVGIQRLHSSERQHRLLVNVLHIMCLYAWACIVLNFRVLVGKELLEPGRVAALLALVSPCQAKCMHACLLACMQAGRQAVSCGMQLGSASSHSALRHQNTCDECPPSMRLVCHACVRDATAWFACSDVS